MRPFVLSTALLLGATAALGDVDVETAPLVKARSTLLPEGEIETYRFTALKGSRFSFALAAEKKKTLVFAPTLTDPANAALPVALKTSKTGVSAKNIPVPATGEYRLDVTATGTGDYSLSLTSAPRTKWSGVVSLAPGGTNTFAFSAPAGSTLSFAVKPAKGSHPTPVFGELSSGAYHVALPAATRAKLTGAAAEGDFLVEVKDQGGGGDVVVSVVVKPPKTKAAKLDLRGAVFGKPGGGETIVKRRIGPAGGAVVVSDPTSDLDGASVTIPASALTSQLAISLASTTTPVIADPAQQAAGPVVDLQPSGTTFGVPAVVVLPFDFTRLPANATPADIRVLVVEQDGSSSVLTPTSVDVPNARLTVETTGFSVCVPVVQPGIVRLGVTSKGGVKPGGDEYWMLFLTDQMDPDGAGNDSRVRAFKLDVGELSFFGDGTLQASNDHRSVRIDEPNNATGGVFGAVTTTLESGNSGSGTFTYLAGGQSIALAPTDGGGDAPVMQVSRRGDAMVGTGRAAGSTKAELNVLLRKNTAPLTTASLSGTWNLGAIEVSGGSSGVGAANLKLKHVFGTLALDGKGKFHLAVDERKSQFESGDGDWASTSKSMSVSGDYEVEAAGTVLVTLPADQPTDAPDVLRLYPGPNAASFVGTDRDAQPGNIFAMVLVKQGSGLSLGSLDGPFASHGIEADTTTYFANTSAVTVGDFEFHDEGVAVTFDGTSPRTFATEGHFVQRDGQTAGGVVAGEETSSFSGAVTVSPVGVYRVSTTGGSAVGAVAADAELGFFVTDVGDARGGHQFAVLVKSPRAK